MLFCGLQAQQNATSKDSLCNECCNATSKDSLCNECCNATSKDSLCNVCYNVCMSVNQNMFPVCTPPPPTHTHTYVHTCVRILPCFHPHHHRLSWISIVYFTRWTRRLPSGSMWTSSVTSCIFHCHLASLFVCAYCMLKLSHQ